MGVCLSLFGSVVTIQMNGFTERQLAETQRLMGIDVGDANRMYLSFQMLDVTGSQEITLKELMIKLHLEPSRFLGRFFSVFDIDHSHGLNFLEFLVATWNLLTLDESHLAFFFADLYANSGEMFTIPMFHKMLADVFGDDWRQSDKAVKSEEYFCTLFDEYADAVDIQEFVNMLHGRYRFLLFPLLTITQAFRQNVATEAFWQQMTEKRLNYYHSKHEDEPRMLPRHAFRDIFIGFAKIYKRSDLARSGSVFGEEFRETGCTGVADHDGEELALTAHTAKKLSLEERERRNAAQIKRIKARRDAKRKRNAQIEPVMQAQSGEYLQDMDIDKNDKHTGMIKRGYKSVDPQDELPPGSSSNSSSKRRAAAGNGSSRRYKK